MTKRRSFSDKFKATVALEALRGDKTAQEIAAKHKVHPTQVTTWKRQAIEGLTGVFSDKVRRAEDNEAEVKELHAKIGKLAVENGVNFIATDMPNADRFMLHVYAAMAEEEARRISDRTRRALAAAKENGVELGRNGKSLAAKHKAEADAFASDVGPVILRLRSDHRMSFRSISDHLNSTQLVPNSKGGRWHPSSVHRLYKRYLNVESVSVTRLPPRYSQATAP